ncbi:MAG: hypothetical protein EOP62_03405 [Sphingomonadales bacterium]|nr:MAG: hypothetical protein EOP62_03405 [Sphingomonadales bacterium]
MYRRHPVLALLPLTLLGASPVPATAPAIPAGTQCKAGETVVYSCRFGKSVGSACMSAKSISYRFGPVGRPAIDIKSDADWSNIHIGGARGGALYQDSLRFTANGYDYVIFDQEAGQYSDVPGKRFSGILVAHGNSDVTQLECKGRAVRMEAWSVTVPERASAITDDRAKLTDEDPRFDRFF